MKTLDQALIAAGRVEYMQAGLAKLKIGHDDRAKAEKALKQAGLWSVSRKQINDAWMFVQPADEKAAKEAMKKFGVKVKAVTEVVALKQDMAPQMILLMGLPAAGKSTFVKQKLQRFYNHRMPHLSSMKILNSDAQLRRMQYERAMRDLAEFQAAGPDGFGQLVAKMQYTSNDGQEIKFPARSFEEIPDAPKQYWGKFYKPYYATYFGDRAQAKKLTEDLADKKIGQGDIVILDSTGVNTAQFLATFKKAKALGYTTSVVWLDIAVEHCIARDQYRGETEGRSVGEQVIRSYVPRLKAAYSTYMGNSALVDRFIHFRWQGGVIKGDYKLMKDHKNYPRKEDLQRLKDKKRKAASVEAAAVKWNEYVSLMDDALGDALRQCYNLGEDSVYKQKAREWIKKLRTLKDDIGRATGKLGPGDTAASVVASKMPGIEKADAALNKQVKQWAKVYRQHKVDPEFGLGSVLIDALGEQQFRKIYQALKQVFGVTTAATIDEVVQYLKQAGILPDGAKGFKPLGPDETWTKLHEDKMVKAVRRGLGTRATAATVDEVVQYLKQAGILPESAKGFKPLGPDETWNRLDQDPLAVQGSVQDTPDEILASTVKQRREVIAELLRAGQQDLANEFARG